MTKAEAIIPSKIKIIIDSLLNLTTKYFNTVATTKLPTQAAN